MQEVGSEDFYIYIGISVILVILSGIFSGLTLGLLSLDKLDLEILTKSGTEQERKNANRILPLVRRHHLLLVTLLLANALVAESLPIFLDDLVPIPIAIIISVTAVLFFGEIIPQSICSKHGLTIGANLAWLVWIIIALFFVIAFPISWLLDCCLGIEEPAFYRRAQLRELVKIHEYQNLEGQEPQGTLTQEEVNIIQGAIDLKDKTVKDRLTPLSQVFMLNLYQKLDYITMEEVLSKGFSRIPIFLHQRDNIVGILLVKRLIALDPQDETSISTLVLHPIMRVTPDMPLYDALNTFQKGKSHIGIVVDTADHTSVLGIITLEDVIEELLQVDIRDESDFTNVKPNYNIASNTNSIPRNPKSAAVLASKYRNITPSPIPPRVRQFVKSSSVSDLLLQQQSHSHNTRNA